MGVTFIGNPFEQENDFDGSDWEMNADEEWVAPPQEIALLEGFARGPIDIILASDAQSEDGDLNWFELNDEEETDEDYDFEPDESYEDDDEDDISCHEPDDEDAEIEANDSDVPLYGPPELFDSHDSTVDLDVDYVTFPIDDDSVSSDKATNEDTANNRETGGAD